jgi:hypothetical protein
MPVPCSIPQRDRTRPWAVFLMFPVPIQIAEHAWCAGHPKGRNEVEDGLPLTSAASMLPSDKGRLYLHMFFCFFHLTNRNNQLS